MTGGTAIGHRAVDAGGICNSGSERVTLENVRFIENRLYSIITRDKG